MANTKPGTSLLAQTEDKKKKWGGDIYNYDINGVIKGYDSAFAEYNAEGTSQERKDAINALYGGDITKWDNKNAYTAYMDDLNEVKYIDSLNKAYTASMDAAKDAEQRKTQYVDTRRMLMQKYLPDTLQAQGLANTGYVADTLLKAENNYNQHLLGAMNDRAQTEQNAMQAYQDSLQSYKQQQANTAYERFMQDQAKKETEEKEAAAKAEANAETNKQNYATFIGAIDEGADINAVVKQAEILGLPTTMIDDLKAYEAAEKAKVQEELYNAYLDNLDALTYEEIESAERNGLLAKPQADALRGKIAEGITKTGATFNDDGSALEAKEGDNFSVTYNGKKYRVENGGEVTDNRIKKYAAKNLEEGQVFAYNNELYIYYGDKVYQIRGRRNSIANNIFGVAKDYDELKAALI